MWKTLWKLWKSLFKSCPPLLGGVLYIFTLAGAIPTVRSSVRNRRVRNIIYRLGRQPVEQ